MVNILVHGIFIFLGVSMAKARPQQEWTISLDDLKPEEKLGTPLFSQEYVNILDAERWKELMAKGKMRDVLNVIQRALGSKRPIRVRTQWGGPEPEQLGNFVRNTVNWHAYQGDKTSLNLIMDSKFTKNDNGKMDMVDPNLGVNFQLKY
uniref:Uncharacterized protein n=1 Tax=Graphocephala atropunctata TaxID=36148 RepID=A0A1B6L958_9HEMI